MKLLEIRDHLNFWEAEAKDLNPYNVDSKDRVHEIHPALAERAVSFLPIVLKDFHDYLLKTKLEKFGNKTLFVINQEHPEIIDLVVDLYEISTEKKLRGVLTYGKTDGILVWSIFDQRDYSESLRDLLKSAGNLKRVDIHYKNAPTGENWITFYTNKGPDQASIDK
jgi:hypothetical protein